MRFKLWLILAFLLVMCMMPFSSQAVNVTLSWETPTTNADGTPLTDLGGYKVYYGNTTRTYGTPIDVKNVSAYTLDLTDGTYFFAITAYDTSGNESVYSNEVSKKIDTMKPGCPINLKIQ